MTLKPEVLAAMGKLRSLSKRDGVSEANRECVEIIRAELLAMDAELTELRTHHAEIAEAVKDAQRYRWLLANAQTIEGRQDWYWWADDADVTPLTERIDAAIAQETQS